MSWLAPGVCESGWTKTARSTAATGRLFARRSPRSGDVSRGANLSRRAVGRIQEAGRPPSRKPVSALTSDRAQRRRGGVGVEVEQRAGRVEGGLVGGGGRGLQRAGRCVEQAGGGRVGPGGGAGRGGGGGGPPPRGGVGEG